MWSSTFVIKINSHASQAIINVSDHYNCFLDGQENDNDKLSRLSKVNFPSFNVEFSLARHTSLRPTLVLHLFCKIVKN